MNRDSRRYRSLITDHVWRSAVSAFSAFPAFPAFASFPIDEEANSGIC
jgi:hypothetical protein